MGRVLVGECNVGQDCAYMCVCARWAMDTLLLSVWVCVCVCVCVWLCVSHLKKTMIILFGQPSPLSTVLVNTKNDVPSHTDAQTSVTMLLK